MAAPRDKAVAGTTTTDTIALADFFTSANLGHAYSYSETFVRINRPGRTYLQDPSVAKDHQPTVDAALVVRLFTPGGEYGALGLQTAQVLLVPAVDDARAPSGEAAYEEG